MKITRQQLIRIIREEKEKLLEADPYGDPPRPGEQGSADETPEELAAMMAGNKDDTEDEEFYIGDLEDQFNSLVFVGKVQGQVDVNTMVSIALSALSDEMRSGFTLPQVMQAVQKWIADQNDNNPRSR
jgi:hypothetical protein